VDVERVAIAPLDTAIEIEAKLAAACVPLVGRALPQLVEGTLPVREQDDTAATYCRKLEKEDGALDFAASAATLAARINGLFPWPGCSVEIAGQVVKIGLADVAGEGADQTRKPGEITGADADGLLVATGAGLLRLRRLQRPGGRMLGAAEFLRGFAVPPGTLLPSRPMTTLVTRR
jgi:methionyl-tRNA formyltransferase